MIFLGIDPGASGGFAMLRDDGATLALTTMPMPETERDRWLAIKGGGATWAMVEQLTPLPSLRREPRALAPVGQVGVELPDSGMRGSVANFKVGVSYGALRAFLIAAEIPFDQAVPRKWQTAMGCPHVKGEARKDHKNRLKARAQQLFPSARITLATADAVLLAEYGRRLWALRNPSNPTATKP